MTPEQIAYELTSPNPQVRTNLAANTSISLTPEQIEIGLQDADDTARWHFASRTDFIATQKQIDRGMNDENINIRISFINRPESFFSWKEASELLESQFSKVAAAILKRPDVSFTAEQFSQAAKHEASNVRNAVANNKNFIPTPEEWFQLLNDSDVSVSMAIAARTDIEVPNETLNDIIIRGTFISTQAIILTRPDFSLETRTLEHLIKPGMVKPKTSIMPTIAQRQDAFLPKDKIPLIDEAIRVFSTVANPNPDFADSLAQIKARSEAIALKEKNEVGKERQRNSTI